MPRAPAKRVDSKTSSDGLTDPDRALLELVRSKKDMGIMRFDMRRESQLQDHVITKSVKTLLAKKVIKEVINIHNKRGKCYMAVEFQPSVELTGGAFYNDGKLDAELINHLKKLCLKIITKMKVATLENIVGSVNKYGLVKFEITLKQIQEIVGTLILDKDVEELKSSETGDFADIPRGKTCYKCLNSAGVEKVGALGSIPCGVCPRISDCTPDGVISPKTCVYYTKCTTMTIEQLDPNSSGGADHISDWLHDSVSFLSSFMDDPYDVDEINGYQWWDQSNDQEQNLISPISLPNVISPAATTATTTTSSGTTIASSSPSNPSKKRKSLETDDNDAVVVEEEVRTKIKRSVSTKKSSGKMGSNCNNGNNKEGRWAEQLLNPCASAMTTGNLTRIQHLLYVLHELASPSGDANHRLAAHGLRALTQHLSSSPTSTLSPPPINYASTEPRLFQQALLKFNEVSPWFAFTNTIANASIIQVLAKEPNYSKNVHILDIGVSHGLQWPTLFEALSRRAGGPPPLLRLTIIAETAQNSSAPFSTGPSGDDYPSILLRFAKSYNLNFQINLIKNQSLQTLTPQIINASKDDNETLIICAQFRLHHLNHTTPDDHRTNFIKTLKDLHPKALILCDNDMECSCIQCSDFATGFARKVDYLWKFLDSTSAAFKGRECEFRRIVEGEAAMALVNRGELNEAKDKWCERIGGVGFSGEGFGEDAIDGGRALLRKYDSNWEMRVDEKDGFARLWWKGQPVSFCSLWTLEKKAVSDS